MAALEPGRIFGSYTLLRRLARGGMGEIWLAERKGISGFTKPVVIKTILEHFIDEADMVRMFLDEGKMAAGLSHPNIAQTLDLGQVDETYYIAMEYLNGRNLRDLLVAYLRRDQLIPLNLVLRIAAQVCEGLYYAHTWRTLEGKPAGLVHRDISPQNIVITFDGTAKIVDFGIARAIAGASKTRTGVLKGKYAYMSPEQVEGKNLDGRSDLFSLGVVLYESISGRRLFKRESDTATLSAVLKSKIPPLVQFDASVPKPVEEVVFKALKRDPNRRFQNAREMQLAIEQVMLSTGLVATSAHLSVFMQQTFPQEAEIGQEDTRSAREYMASIPSVSDTGPNLERTVPFAISEQASGAETAAPTANLLEGAKLLSQRDSRRRTWVVIAVLLAINIALGAYLLFILPHLEKVGTVANTAQAADTGEGKSIEPQTDGSYEIQTNDAGGLSDTADAGTTASQTADDAVSPAEETPRSHKKKRRKSSELEIKLER